ncbi:MAG: inositol monophosphatase family protein, partial [Bacteroidota bacterium]
MPLPLDTAVHAAREAAALIRREAGRADVRYKGPQDLVTATDEAAQHLIGAILVEAFPDSFVVGEEGPTQDAPPGTRMRWIVDPIDGTINFAHGAPAYAVSIGLEVDGAMEVGVILDVSRD